MTRRVSRVPTKRAPSRTEGRSQTPAVPKRRGSSRSGRRDTASQRTAPAWARYRDAVIGNAFVASIMGIVVLGAGFRLAESLVAPQAPASVTETLLRRIAEAERRQIQDLPSGFKMTDEVRRAIDQAARDVGIDARYLAAVAAKESGFDPSARADRSTAEGLFQFTQTTWLRVVKVFGAKHGLSAEADRIVVDRDGGVSMPDAAARSRLLQRRNDPRLSAAMAAELGIDNRARLERLLGRSATPAETYIAHFLGVTQAAVMIEAARATPLLAGARLLPAAAASNPGVFGAAGDAETVKAIVTKIDAYFAIQVPSLSRL
jgi:hypothetical protein